MLMAVHSMCQPGYPWPNSGSFDNWGESHFIRDGIWIATKWVNASPDGYTHDMVTTIFGAE